MASEPLRAQNQLRKPFISSGFGPKNRSRTLLSDKFVISGKASANDFDITFSLEISKILPKAKPFQVFILENL